MFPATITMDRPNTGMQAENAEQIRSQRTVCLLVGLWLFGSVDLCLSAVAQAHGLLDADGLTVARFCYGGTGECAQAAASDESLTRSPELIGDFVPHTTVGAGGSAFSPGTRADGTSF